MAENALGFQEMLAGQNAHEATAAATGGGRGSINRREFMFYAWGAAMALLTAQTVTATYDFLSPRFGEGEFGGKFALGAASELPEKTAAPQARSDGKFWLVDTEEGPRALYMVCTHLGCLYKWDDSLGYFRCPCHASEFTHDGELQEGPAARGLDQFVVEVVENGEVVAQTVEKDGQIVPPAVTSPQTQQLVVNTGRRIRGLPGEA